MTRLIACCLIASCLDLAIALPMPAQTTGSQRTRDAVQSLPIGGRMTVQTLDGRELHGNLSAIDADSFVIREVDLKTRVTVRYAEVRAIEKDYGRKGFAGQRVSPHRSRIAAIIILGGLVTLIAVVALTKD